MSVSAPITPAERIAFRDAFSAAWIFQAQQRESRLREYARRDPIAQDARYAYFDVFGKRDPVPKTQVAEPTPNRKSSAGRRRASLTPWHDGEVFDRDEIRKMAKKPQSAFLAASMAGFMRQVDRTILAAAVGTAYDLTINPNDPTDLGSALAVPLPSAQKIVHGSTGLSIAKLRAAKKLMDQNEVEEEGRWAAVTATQLDNLLGTTEVTSADYNTVKALVRGEIDTFLGWKFRRTELVPSFIDSGPVTIRQCVFGSRDAIGWYGDERPTTEMGPRVDLSFTEQFYLHMNQGAVRLEDYRIIEVQCKE